MKHISTRIFIINENYCVLGGGGRALIMNGLLQTSRIFRGGAKMFNLLRREYNCINLD